MAQCVARAPLKTSVVTKHVGRGYALQAITLFAPWPARSFAYFICRLYFMIFTSVFTECVFSVFVVLFYNKPISTYYTIGAPFVFLSTTLGASGRFSPLQAQDLDQTRLETLDVSAAVDAIITRSLQRAKSACSQDLANRGVHHRG